MFALTAVMVISSYICPEVALLPPDGSVTRQTLRKIHAEAQAAQSRPRKTADALQWTWVGGRAMQKSQQAILGAILAVPFLCAAKSAGAAPPPTGRYVYVPAGATVVVLPGRAMAAVPVNISPTPMAFPVAGMIAQQDAMMQRMIADMNAMFAMPMPDPQQFIEAAMHSMPQPGSGTGVLMTLVSSGRGVCSETITYDYPANGAKPQVHVVHSGNACGDVTMPGPASPVAAPIVPRAIPDTAPASAPPRLWTARDNARPVGRRNPGA
jgi:hypothetical protein